MSSTDLQAFVDAGVAELAAARNADGGWGHRPGSQSGTEATALTLLALAAWRPQHEALSGGRQFLQVRQRSDGAFAGSVAVPEPSWATPLAGMALAGSDVQPAAAAADWLLSAPVFTLSPTPSIYGYDTTIPGWPWTSGDYSFVEPTSAALVFLKRQGHSAQPRVRDGVAMLRARAFADGTWNYGEPVVLGNTLAPAVVPTAMALLALADEPDDKTAAALDWLAAQRGTVSSLFSLGWAAIAVNLWGMLDDAWIGEVAGRWFACPPGRRTTLDTALCLLGVAARNTHPFAL